MRDGLLAESSELTAPAVVLDVKEDYDALEQLWS